MGSLFLLTARLYFLKRITACLIVFGAVLVLGTLSSLGYGVLSNVRILGNDILDTFDKLANNILMPIVAIITCVIAGWFIDKNIIPKEIGIDKSKKTTVYFNVIIIESQLSFEIRFLKEMK